MCSNMPHLELVLRCGLIIINKQFCVRKVVTSQAYTLSTVPCRRDGGFRIWWLAGESGVFLAPPPNPAFATAAVYFIHRVTVTKFCSVFLPVDFCRHFVGKTLRNVCRCDSA